MLEAIMKRTQSQFRRLHALHTSIQQKKFPNCLKFAKDWEVSQKTVQRDIDFLRDSMGAPLDYDKAQQGYYYTEPNWFLPAMTISEGDLLAIALSAKAVEQYQGTPLASKLEQSFQRLSDLLPDKISVRPEFLSLRFTFTGTPAKAVNENIWLSVVRGLLTQRRVKIDYRSMQAKHTKTRLMDPYHIANLQGEWYVFAYCHLTNQIIQYSIARISKATLTDNPFDVSPEWDADAYLSQVFGRYASNESIQKVRLVFDQSVVPWVLERQWHPKQKVKKLKNGDIELEFKTAGVFEVYRWVLSWGRYVRVLEPEGLKKDVAEEVRALSHIYGK